MIINYDDYKHSPCSVPNCGRKSIFRAFSEEGWIAACNDHLEETPMKIKQYLEDKKAEMVVVRMPK